MYGWADERVFDGAGEQVLCGGGRNQKDRSPVPLSSPPQKRGPIAAAARSAALDARLRGHNREEA